MKERWLSKRKPRVQSVEEGRFGKEEREGRIRDLSN
jgi:hypothetical protein